MMLRVLLLGDGLIFRKIVSLELCVYFEVPVEYPHRDTWKS